jgi:hypothetical protein
MMKFSMTRTKSPRCAQCAEVSGLEKQLEQANKAMESERKRYDDLLRERDILTKLKSQAESSSVQQVNLIKINEGTKRNLEQEIQGFKIEAQKQQRLVFQLDKEREKYGQEASNATSKHVQVCSVSIRQLTPAHFCSQEQDIATSWESPARLRKYHDKYHLHTTPLARLCMVLLRVD